MDVLTSEIPGFLDPGRVHGWQVTHILIAAAGSSDIIGSKAFDWLCEPILSSINKHLYDGLLLGFHGAMGNDLPLYQWTPRAYLFLNIVG